MKPKGWYSRGYLPHCDDSYATQMVTFRLADLMPAHLLEYWNAAVKNPTNPEVWEVVEKYLDQGRGSCCLKDGAVALLVENAFIHFDQQRYDLMGWVVMPNHVHVLLAPRQEYSLSQIVHSWKSYTAKEINTLLQRTGTLWQREYFDRYIRSEQHYYYALNYIHQNPVKAGLVERAEDWPYSSLKYVPPASCRY